MRPYLLIHNGAGLADDRGIELETDGNCKFSELADSEKAVQSGGLMFQFEFGWELLWKYAGLRDSGSYRRNLEGLNMNCQLRIAERKVQDECAPWT